MKGEWCYFRSYLDKSTCEKIIKEAQVVPPQDALVGTGTGEQIDTSVRKSLVRFLNAGDWRFNYIFDLFWKTVISANKDFYDVHISKLDFIQFTEYSDQYKGEYKEHHDVFWMNGDPVYHRKLSAVIQLSDPSTYEGGDFILTEAVSPPPNNEVREQGTILYFPSMMRHKVTPVTRGKRYSLVAWFDGPKWR